MQRCAQFVADHREEPAFRLAGVFRCLLGQAQFLLGELARRHFGLKRLVRGLQRGQRIGEALLQAPLGDRPADGLHQFRPIQAVLEEVIAHTALHRLDRDHLVAMSRHEHGGARQRALSGRLGQKLQAGHVRQAVIKQQAIGRMVAQQRQPAGAVSRDDKLAIEQGLTCQKLDVTAPVDLIVLDNQQAMAQRPIAHMSLVPNSTLIIRDSA